jgi:hypothetical protein
MRIATGDKLLAFYPTRSRLGKESFDYLLEV